MLNLPKSSYALNNFGQVFFDIVIKHKPKLAVELGVLDGYSALHIAQGLCRNDFGSLDAWDLWDDYSFRHGIIGEVKRVLEKAEVADRVQLLKGNAYSVHKNYKDNSIDLLHIDIGNTGIIFKELFELWDRKLCCGGILLFEGGSKERDSADWMIKFGKEPIRPILFGYSEVNKRYTFRIIEKWPSLTLLIKELSK